MPRIVGVPVRSRPTGSSHSGNTASDYIGDVAGQPDDFSSRLSDEQSVLLWQACAYAQDLIDAIESNQDASGARRELLRFIQRYLLPYLRFEESEVSDRASPSARLSRLQRADHDRIRLAADTFEASVSRAELAIGVQSLIECLSRHIWQEQLWITDADLAEPVSSPYAPCWTPPLLGDRVDLTCAVGDRQAPDVDQL